MNATNERSTCSGCGGRRFGTWMMTTGQTRCLCYGHWAYERTMELVSTNFDIAVNRLEQILFLFFVRVFQAAARLLYIHQPWNALMHLNFIFRTNKRTIKSRKISGLSVGSGKPYACGHKNASRLGAHGNPAD